MRTNLIAIFSLLISIIFKFAGPFEKIQVYGLNIVKERFNFCYVQLLIKLLTKRHFIIIIFKLPILYVISLTWKKTVAV